MLWVVGGVGKDLSSCGNVAEPSVTVRGKLSSVEQQLFMMFKALVTMRFSQQLADHSCPIAMLIIDVREFLLSLVAYTVVLQQNCYCLLEYKG